MKKCINCGSDLECIDVIDALDFNLSVDGVVIKLICTKCKAFHQIFVPDNPNDFLGSEL